MSKIFIIGATGGVGSRLGPLLVEAGHDVTGLVHAGPAISYGSVARGNVAKMLAALINAPRFVERL